MSQPNDDFIGIFPDVLSPDFCRHLITRFDSDLRHHAGRTGHGVDTAKKNSADITLNDFEDWKTDLTTIHNHTIKGLLQYVRKFPHILIGALSLQWTPPGQSQSRIIEAADIADMDNRQLFGFVNAVFKSGKVNLQKYKRGSGGYHHWHSEYYPSATDDGNESLHRVLLWMYYLNDIKDGGGTSFYYQDRTLSPKQGTLVIAPANFTHTHKGDIPLSGDKYILTSWILYRDRKALYGLS